MSDILEHLRRRHKEEKELGASKFGQHVCKYVGSVFNTRWTDNQYENIKASHTFSSFPVYLRVTYKKLSAQDLWSEKEMSSLLDDCKALSEEVGNCGFIVPDPTFRAERAWVVHNWIEGGNYSCMHVKSESGMVLVAKLGLFLEWIRDTRWRT